MMFKYRQGFIPNYQLNKNSIIGMQKKQLLFVQLVACYNKSDFMRKKINI
jgi:hypothetical protein